MQIITLVTGNQGKLNEYKQLLPESTTVAFANHTLDLPEIQSLDLEEIVKDKLLKAFDELKGPIIVEDVAAGLESLHGLPGPFIKFFEQRMGKSALFELAKKPAEAVIITCVTGYYDGKTMLFGHGELHGTVVEPRGENGFGFDFVIVPDGEQHTMAELGYDKKNQISHRAQAVKSLITQLLNQTLI
jgi:inosine triphosphate pyrophosphatase